MDRPVSTCVKNKPQKSTISCEVFLSPDRTWLQHAWQSLEERCHPVFFLSWHWIGCWLDCFVRHFYVIEARIDGRTVGLGVIVSSQGRPSRFHFAKQYYLHRTGDDSLDQIWIEYNDFLLEPAVADAVREKMLATLMAEVVGDGVLSVGACYRDTFTCAPPDLDRHQIWATSAYSVDFTAYRAKDLTPSQALSRSARYQIRRSLREYESLGPLTVTQALTVKDALCFFELARPLHIKRWGSQPGQSGFVNDGFRQFHQTLISRGIEDGSVAIYKVMAGQTLISVMYNFHWQNQVYFYLCALNYEIKGCHSKPGLVSHYLLINDAFEQGFDGYDFMGGFSRYKKTFANHETELAIYHIRQNRLRVRLEHTLRAIKQQFVTDEQSSASHPD